jgi:glutamate/tyrosine decarboxylase-like PLP-dependent enzyme
MEQVKLIHLRKKNQILKRYYFFEFEGFNSYNDLTNNEMKTAERLIIQLDSLPRLNNKDFIPLQNDIPEYNLIVVDQSEGILSHFDAKTLKKK